MEKRTVGRFNGRPEGPLLICIGGMHGNEPAGITAIQKVLQLLEQGKADYPDFSYFGTFLGVRGNLEALRLGKRFVDRDLNRMLSDEEINQFSHQPPALLLQEEKECLELLQLISSTLQELRPPLTLILDLHTTTASGGAFSIAADDPMSLQLASGLHIPVVLGIASGLKGTTIDYFNHPDENTHCVVFEAGQHDDPESIDRTVSVIINCMQALHSADPIHIDHRHDDLLKRLGDQLPKVTRLVYHYKIHPGEKFIMKEGFKNFDKVSQGEPLALNQKGSIFSPRDGLILMPKYQALGDDGFFLVEEIKED